MLAAAILATIFPLQLGLQPQVKPEQNGRDAEQAVVNQPDADEPAVQIWRVRAPDGDEVVSREGPEGPLYSAGPVSTDTKLPVGYPRPTPPGAIEIKQYPSIRQAEVSGTNSLLSSQRGFMPLFNHIQSRQIAMTAPVEMRYADEDKDGDSDSWTMAFLYHTTENGPTGSDGRIEVIDTEPITVLSLGVRGERSPEATRKHFGELETWIDAHSDEWVRAGDVRVLGYNGPYVPVRDRWWEVQIPIARVSTAEDSGSEAAAENNSGL